MNYLYPNKENISTDQNLPIPIETIYFLEESKRDANIPNRFYFDYPAQWLTSNKGESVIGVRNIYLCARRRKLEFELFVRKYYREDYDKIKAQHPDYTDDEIYDQIDNWKKSLVSYNVTSWLPVERDLREIWLDMTRQMSTVFDTYNKYWYEIEKGMYTQEQLKIDELSNKQTELITEWNNETDTTKKQALRKEIENLYNEINTRITDMYKIRRPEFRLELGGLQRRDIQTDGYYDYNKRTFIETFFSPCNAPKTQDTKDYIFNRDKYDYYVDLKIDFIHRPFDENGNQDNSINQKYDFADVMNIGTEPFQNRPEKYKKFYYDDSGKIIKSEAKWLREITFENVWDRHSCKVFSSFACDSSKGYLGNSQIFYHTLKYFKLNSTDQQFWIEFYSGRHNNIPVYLPLNESFNIELQFLPYNKMLYI